jgi:sugar phosphate isomerase/epimerase
MPVDDAVKAIQRVGLVYVSIKDFHLPLDSTPEQRKAVAAKFKAAGITPLSVGNITMKNDVVDVRRAFEYARDIGVPAIVCSPDPDSMKILDTMVKEFDIRIAIHNHGPEDKLWPSPLDILKDIGNMDPRIGCCIDVGHTVRAGTDVVQAIHAVGPRLYNVHMKDLTDFTAKDSQVAVGDGMMPVRQIFEALIATKYDGFVDLEYEVHADDPMPGVSSSFAYMRGVLAGMGYSSRG